MYNVPVPKTSETKKLKSCLVRKPPLPYVGKDITKDKSNSSITFLKKCDEYDEEDVVNVDYRRTVFDRGKISSTQFVSKTDLRPGRVKFGPMTIHIF